MEWFVYVFLAAVVYTLVELVDKFIVDNEIQNYKVASVVCGLPIFSFYIASGTLFGNPVISLEPVLLAVFLGFLNSFSLFSYYSGISEEDIDRFVPSLSLNTVFILFLSFFLLHESFDLVTYSGVGLVVFGAVTISLEDPSKSLRNFQSSRAVRLGVLTAFLGAVSSVGVKYLTVSIQMWSVMFWIGVGGLLASTGLGFLNRSNITRSKLKGYRHLILVGVLTSFAYLFFVRALTQGPVTLVSTTIKMNSVMIFLGSVTISRLHPDIMSEKLDRALVLQKTVSITVILVGVALIKLF